MSYPENHWNYRVMGFTDKRGNAYRAIHSVHYEYGVPTSYSEEPESVVWDTDEGDDSPRQELMWMLEAIDRPVLKESDFE